MDLEEKEILEESWRQSCLLWAIDNQIKMERGQAIDFKKYRFLKDIYDDFTPIQAVRKASQIGFTVMNVLKTFWAAKHFNWNIIYTLPTFSDVGQIVPSKVNPLISNNSILQEWTADKDSVQQKKVGKGFIYYRGTFASDKDKMQAGVGIMFSSDLNVHDECDRSDQKILEQYESRLASSDYKGRWYFSNPTAPNTVSQKIYEKSDQKYWFVKCEHCGKWQYLDFWKNIQEGKYVCVKCKGELSSETRQNGQWVKKYLNRSISGYWISHLICPWISAKEIEEEYKTKGKQYFYNFVLGLPYIGSDIVVNRDIILKCIELSKPNFRRHNVLGVDVGRENHYVLMNRQGIFKIGKTEKWEDIDNLIKIYDVEMCVIDAMPDLTMPKKMLEKYPGIAWISYFKKEVKSAEFIKWDYKTHTVYSDRTKIIQNTIDKFVNREIRIQLKPEDLEEYIKHWETLYRVEEEDTLGIKRDIWESSGEDHFTFATVYAMLGLEKTEGGGTQIREWEEAKIIDTNRAPDIKSILEKQKTLD